MSDEIKYYRITNWKKRQRSWKDHGSGMPMPGFMLDPGILLDPKFRYFSTTTRLTYIALLCAAARQNQGGGVSCTWAEVGLEVGCGGARVGLSIGYLLQKRVIIEEGTQKTSLNELSNEVHIANARFETSKPAGTLRPQTGRILLELWNTSGLKPVRNFSSKRDQVLSSAWSEEPTKGYWTDLFGRVLKSKFLMGGGKGGWVAPIEWVVENRAKILDGEFDDRDEKQESKKIDFSKLDFGGF